MSTPEKPEPEGSKPAAGGEPTGTAADSESQENQPAGNPAGPPAPPGGGGKRRLPGPRWAWVTAAAVVGVLLLVLAFGAGRMSGRMHDRMAWIDRADGGPGGHGRMHHGPFGPDGPGAPGAPGGPGFGPGGPGGPGFGPGGPGGMHERWGDDDGDGDGPRGPGFRFAERGGPEVVGAVASVNGPTVVVNSDGAGPVNVATDAGTRVGGEQRKAVADLKPGDRVIVFGQEGQPARAVVVAPAHVAGVVTALEGDRATVTSPDGLTRAVDLATVGTKPKVGDRIMARGTVADNGATVKAESVRIATR
ncbi:hypothetical protein BKA01_000888 [Pseudonocardia eucalypti]|nr:hypothetical protein [Pseudonocardia eucalypti]